MGPGGLGQVLDGHTDPGLPFNEQHIAWLEACQEPLGIHGRCGAVVVPGCRQVLAELPPDPAGHPVKGVFHDVVFSKVDVSPDHQGAGV